VFDQRGDVSPAVTIQDSHGVIIQTVIHIVPVQSESWTHAYCKGEPKGANVLSCNELMHVSCRSENGHNERNWLVVIMRLVKDGWGAVKRNFMSLHVMVFVIPWSAQCQLQFASAATGA
jgi:hypothetical protein